MTSITFGGGPSLEARRNFSNLKPGSQVPGYSGHIHQFKFHNGHTYGDQTHLLHDKFPEFKRSNTMVNIKPEYMNSNIPQEFIPKEKYILKNELPKATGGNKLTESMIPGYTGYVPTRKYRFSDTYRAECDQSIDEFLTQRQNKTKDINDTMNTIRSYQRFAPTASDSEVQGVLSKFRDQHPNTVTSREDRRAFDEAPIPGYTGFIPRIVPTELGLGARYHDACEKGLNDFKNSYISRAKSGIICQSNNRNQYQPQQQQQQQQQSCNQNDGGFDENSRAQSANSNKRIFVPPGLIPRYTGYVHGKKFEFGNTYGDTTRSLPVCSHDLPSFGEYNARYPPKTAMC